MATLTPVQGNPFEARPKSQPRLTPVPGNPFGDPVDQQEQPSQPAQDKQSVAREVAGSLGDTGLEFAAAFNRGVTKLADFLTTDQVNAVAQVLGSEFRVPSITETLSPATSGNFMQDGLAKDTVRSAGELAPAAATGGAVLRQAAQQLPRFTAVSEGTASGILRQAGQGSLAGDAALGAAAGAGQELVGAAGEEVGGDTGRFIGEVIGSLGLPIGLAAGAGKLRSAADAATSRMAVAESAPDIPALKTASRKLYGEIDDLGVTLKPEVSAKLADELAEVGRQFGVDPDIVPKAAKAVRRFDDLREMSPSLSDIDTLRRVAQNAARSLEPAEAKAGGELVKRLDDFMDNLNPGSFQRGEADPKEVSQKYRQARKLWGQARRSELIDEAFTKARNQASGFENGLRVQFRSLLNNKKTRKMFSPEEQAAMRKVVEGGTGENLFRLLGRFAPSEGAAHNVITSGAGVAGGAAIGGPVGAVAVPALGYVSRGLAARMTEKNARMADQLIRAGSSASKIADAYVRNTPKGQRSAEELSELFMRQDVDLGTANAGIAKAAADIAKRKRAEIVGPTAAVESANDPYVQSQMAN